MKRLTVKATEAGTRLDLFLRDRLSISRALVQKMIAGGQISIGERAFTAHTPVEKGMVVRVEKPVEEAPTAKSMLPPPTLTILYEDADVLVFEKPAGLLVHPATGSLGPTLVDALLAHAPKMKKVGDDSSRPGLVQRLDKDVSGVMIAAKNQKAFRVLKEQFQAHTIEKEYLALVHEHLPRTVDTIRLRIARSTRKARMAARPESQEGKEAVTHYEVIKSLSHFDYIRVRIETGRTHQIRAHFHALGHPVVGDPLYRQKAFKPFPLDRLFLHAHKLTITLPNGERRTFVSPLPAVLEMILKDLS